MATLRRNRKPRNRKGQLRAHAGKHRKRRNLVKFIPEADSDFAFTANRFLRYLRMDPEAYGVSQEAIDSIESAVSAYRSLLAQSSYRLTSNSQLVLLKDAARKKAESVVRRYANIIRANPDVTDSNKTLLRIKIRPKRLGKRKCPKHPPRLEFVGPGDGHYGIHVLKYFESDDGKTILASATYAMNRRARPDGAARIEVYFDMIPPGEPVPKVPTERGWPKYLRSYTRSPMEVEVPVPREPMLIVYWAKWADSTGETSRWSKPCVARIEGWTPTMRALPEGEHAQDARRVETKVVYVSTPIAGELPDGLAGDLFRALPKLLEGGGAMEVLRERLLGSSE